MWLAFGSVSIILCLVLIQSLVPNWPERLFNRAIHRQPEHYAEPINAFRFGLQIGMVLFLFMLFTLFTLHVGITGPV